MNADISFEGFCDVAAQWEDFSDDQRALVLTYQQQLDLLDELGVDSQSEIGFFFFLEETFDISIPINNRDLQKKRTLGILYGIVWAELKKRSRAFQVRDGCPTGAFIREQLAARS